MTDCGNYDSFHSVFLSFLIFYFCCLLLCCIFVTPQLLSVSKPFHLTSFVSQAKTTVDCIHIDLGRYVMASHPLAQ